jgi:hypothetical protein
MFEWVRFIRYALRFERAFKTDEWSEVKRCFADDAVYTIEGSASRFDGDYVGPDAIAGVFKQMLDEVDRKYDKRIPRLGGMPKKRAGELTIPWRATYVKGDERVILNGVSACRFAGKRIKTLRDTMIADECARWAAVVGATP